MFSPTNWLFTVLFLVLLAFAAFGLAWHIVEDILGRGDE